jgi:hypothetical protein
MGDALLIIDVQRNMFDPDPVHDAGALVERLDALFDGDQPASDTISQVNERCGQVAELMATEEVVKRW